MNDQVVELASPGLQILLYSPFVAVELEDGGMYAKHFPDGKDLVDYMNECRFAALAMRWPGRDYWLHFSTTDQQLCVRGSDDLHGWRRECPNEQLVTVEDGIYDVTACMVPYNGDGPLRIYLHLAPAVAMPELGYGRVPELFCEAPVF